MDVESEIVDLCETLVECSKTLTLLAKRVKKLKKHMKQPSTSKGIMKKCRLSPELCDFMNRDHDILMSRNEVKSYLCLYIDTHELSHNPDNRSEFQPDEALQSILLPLTKEDAQGKTNKQGRFSRGYTKFNILRYIKHHFTKVSN